MFHLFPGITNNHTPTNPGRRQFARMSTLAAASIAARLTGNLPGALRGAYASEPTQGRRAQSCISIFLCGGPSQPDLWDLKPEAPLGVRSEFQSIQTNVPGLQFGELIPQVARHADKLALIRSMTHSNNDHNGAIVHSLLGQLSSVPGQLYINRNDHPGLGAIVRQLLGDTAPLPAWVILPRFFGTNSPAYKGQCGGFLGPSADPLLFDKERIGSLSDAPLRIGALDLPSDIDSQRLNGRIELQRSVGRTVSGAQSMQRDQLNEQAIQLLAESGLRNTFSLEREPESVRNRYGRNEYGQSLLMARRLVESGVRFVNVFWTFFDAKGCQFNLWDNHGVPNDVCGIDGQLTGRQQLTHRYCTPSFDQSFSALLEDLSDRGLLDQTLVSIGGEFGRTPKINATSGRDHWAHCYTHLLAGGGVQGGAIYGSSDAVGAYVRDSPVTPDDLAATILHGFGLDADQTIPDQSGRPVRISTGRAVTALF
jgi:hypothetical protein